MFQFQIPLVSTTGGLADTVIDGYTGLQMGAFSVEVSTDSFKSASYNRFQFALYFLWNSCSNFVIGVCLLFGSVKWFLQLMQLQLLKQS